MQNSTIGGDEIMSSTTSSNSITSSLLTSLSAMPQKGTSTSLGRSTATYLGNQVCRYVKDGL